MQLRRASLLVVTAACLAFAAGSRAQITEPGIHFFNEISGKLVIELTRPRERIRNLANFKAPPDAKIRNLTLKARIVDEAFRRSRALTEQELARIVVSGPRIKLAGLAKIAVEHAAPNGKYFTVADILKAIEVTERQTRDATEWFGGVDIHHIHLEGLHPKGGGVWEIQWGS